MYYRDSKTFKCQIEANLLCVNYDICTNGVITDYWDRFLSEQKIEELVKEEHNIFIEALVLLMSWRKLSKKRLFMSVEAKQLLRDNNYLKM